MTTERLDTVLAAKADAAWHLHEATRRANLAAFVFYSSASGILGRPARPTMRPRTRSWTPWPPTGPPPGCPGSPWPGACGPAEAGMSGGRSGPALTAAQGRALLDRALRTDVPVLVPALLEAAAPTPAAAPQAELGAGGNCCRTSRSPSGRRPWPG